MKKIKKILALALVLVFVFAFAFTAASASVAHVENHECSATAVAGDTIEPARAYPCHNCDTGMLRKVLIYGTYLYRCDQCGYLTSTP